MSLLDELSALERRIHGARGAIVDQFARDVDAGMLEEGATVIDQNFCSDIEQMLGAREGASPRDERAQYATLRPVVYDLPMGGFIVRYRWEGDLQLPVIIRDAPRVVPLLPWPVRRIGPPDFVSRGGTYIRTDVRGWRGRVVYYRMRYALRRAAEFLSVRIVLTLAVWGLADYDPGTIPSWRDVRLLRWRRG